MRGGLCPTEAWGHAPHKANLTHCLASSQLSDNLMAIRLSWNTFCSGWASVDGNSDLEKTQKDVLRMKVHYVIWNGHLRCRIRRLRTEKLKWHAAACLLKSWLWVQMFHNRTQLADGVLPSATGGRGQTAQKCGEAECVVCSFSRYYSSGCPAGKVWPLAWLLVRFCSLILRWEHCRNIRSNHSQRKWH